MKKLYFILFIAIFLYPQYSQANCLEYGILGATEDKNSIEFLEKSFPICARLNQCNIAKKELDKLKNIDKMRYAYIMGSALANGDCYKKDIVKAEKLLLSCAEKSIFCARNLTKLYGLYAKDLGNYEAGAIDLLTFGDFYSLFLLIDLYTQKYIDRNNIFSKYGPVPGMFAYKYCRYAIDIINIEIKSRDETIRMPVKNNFDKYIRDENIAVKNKLQKILSKVKQRADWLEGIFGKEKLNFFEKNLQNEVNTTLKYMDEQNFYNDIVYTSTLMYTITGVPQTKKGYNNIKPIKFYDNFSGMERISSYVIMNLDRIR